MTAGDGVESDASEDGYGDKAEASARRRLVELDEPRSREVPVGTRLAAVTYGWTLPTAQNLELQRE